MRSQNDIKKVLTLGDQYQQIAGKAFIQASQQYSHTSPEFLQAYHDYKSTMDNVLDMYYLAIHGILQILEGDLNNIDDATKQLQDSLEKLKAVESYMLVTLKILTVAALVTTAVVDPTHISAPAAVGAVMDLTAAIAAAQKHPKNN